MDVLRNIALVFCLLAPLWSSDDMGMALYVEGEVYVTRGILDFEAQVEDVLMWGDEIETGDDGSLQMVLDASLLSIGPNTVLSFEKREGEAGEELFVVQLEEGALRSKVLNLGSRQFFEVESDSGSLRVHGTDFVTRAGGGAFDVSVLQGKVEVFSPGSSDLDVIESAVDVAVQEVVSVGVAQPLFVSGGETGGLGEGAAPWKEELSDVGAVMSELPLPGDVEPQLYVPEDVLTVDVDVITEDVGAVLIEPNLNTQELGVKQRTVELELEFTIVDGT